jgi:hypothetical protein
MAFGTPHRTDGWGGLAVRPWNLGATGQWTNTALAYGGAERALLVDMWSTCAHALHMSKMIQLRNVPDSLHRQLKARAAIAGLPLSDYLIREVARLTEHPTPEEMRDRLKTRSAYRGSVSPTAVLRAERDRC